MHSSSIVREHLSPRYSKRLTEPVQRISCDVEKSNNGQNIVEELRYLDKFVTEQMGNSSMEKIQNTRAEG